MRWLRAGFRLIAFLLVVTLVSSLRLAGRLLLSGTTDRRWRNFLFRLWARTMQRVIGMRSTVNGPVPAAPFFLVANHLGYVDIALLAGAVDATFVAKRDVKAWPFIGWAVAVFDALFIDRESKRDIVAANGRIAEAIERGEGLVLFPEGTSSGGEGVLPLKPSLFQWPASAEYPVHYATLRYRTPAGGPPARTAVCWWGGMRFLPHFVALLSMPSFEAALTFGSEPVRAKNRKVLANRVHDLLQNQLEQMDRTPEEGMRP